jgi:hypothetical protein
MIQAAGDLAIPAYSGRPENEHPILAPCSRFEDRYDTLGFSDAFVEEWPEIYHEQVDKVVEEFLKPQEFECNADDYESFMPPGPELESLAGKLPTWKITIPLKPVPLSQYDIGRVLLEYLRIYECALMEFDEFRYFDTTQEEYSKPGVKDFFISDLMEETLRRESIIRRERIIARKTLHRVLSIIGTFGRLRPLEAELECTQRLSLDIRNIAALTAETSSCLPRSWNAKDALRDFEEKE